ncbi:hypothetical protein [[Phormidium] sp. ETS-05]|uniref:hypothetical protein n=1 Tax=[Phormidium] sp. ETS-05 TaxID=222819 RepID=UPI0018EF0121|nr:hypothetical protein [[Phormidium] sp. ETS-05]
MPAHLQGRAITKVGQGASWHDRPPLATGFLLKAAPLGFHLRLAAGGAGDEAIGWVIAS